MTSDESAIDNETPQDLAQQRLCAEEAASALTLAEESDVAVAGTKERNNSSHFPSLRRDAQTRSHRTARNTFGGGQKSRHRRASGVPDEMFVRRSPFLLDIFVRKRNFC